MLCEGGHKRSHLQKEFRLEKENFACGTSYVGIEDCTISFFFVKPTVPILGCPAFDRQLKNPLKRSHSVPSSSCES